MSKHAYLGSDLEIILIGDEEGMTEFPSQVLTEDQVAECEGKFRNGFKFYLEDGVLRSVAEPQLHQDPFMKMARAEEVANIKVTTSQGRTFDGDEISQERMLRAAMSMLEGETIKWILADNTIVDVDSPELFKALRLAGQAQSQIFTG